MSQVFSNTWVGRLFDDESVRKKLGVMSKWEAIIDDARNEAPDVHACVEDFLKLGKSYRISVTLEELPEPTSGTQE